MAWVDWYSATRISASISTSASKTCGGQVSEVRPRWRDSSRLAASRVRDEVVILESMITQRCPSHVVSILTVAGELRERKDWNVQCFRQQLESPRRTYERVQNLRPYRKSRGAHQRRDRGVGYARVPRWHSPGAAESRESDEFLGRRRWPPLGEGPRQPRT